MDVVTHMVDILLIAICAMYTLYTVKVPNVHNKRVFQGT